MKHDFARLREFPWLTLWRLRTGKKFGLARENSQEAVNANDRRDTVVTLSKNFLRYILLCRVIRPGLHSNSNFKSMSRARRRSGVASWIYSGRRLITSSFHRRQWNFIFRQVSSGSGCCFFFFFFSPVFLYRVNGPWILSRFPPDTRTNETFMRVGWLGINGYWCKAARNYSGEAEQVATTKTSKSFLVENGRSAAATVQYATHPRSSYYTLTFFSLGNLLLGRNVWNVYFNAAVSCSPTL